jgi:hypothetical protein
MKPYVVARTLRGIGGAVGALVLALAFSGCATMSEEQCLANDWRTVGYADGANGYSQARLLKHQDACMKHGVNPDREAYLVGHRDGLTVFCTPRNGFIRGQNGYAYSKVCPAELDGAFQAAYQDGRQIYLAAAEVKRLNALIVAKSAAVEEIKQELILTEQHLVSDETTSEERAGLLEHTKELSRKQGELENEIEELKVQAALKSRELAELRETLAYL